MQPSSELSQYTALIVPNELVTLVTSIIDKFKNVTTVKCQSQDLQRGSDLSTTTTSKQESVPNAIPALHEPPSSSPVNILAILPLPSPPSQINSEIKLSPEIVVYSNNICPRGVNCYSEDCFLIHFPKHPCHHKDLCNMNKYNICGFIHPQYENVMNKLSNGFYNLYNGWDSVLPDWAKTAKGRASHFKQNIIYSSKKIELKENNSSINQTVKRMISAAIRPVVIKNPEPGEINDNIMVKYNSKNNCNHCVCIDWIIKDCNNESCKKVHYLPSNYKTITCNYWKNNECKYGSKYCKDIHGSNDLITYYIERNKDKLYYMDGNDYEIKASNTRRSRSRSRSRDRNDNKY